MTQLQYLATQQHRRVCVCVLCDSGYHVATADHLPSSRSVTCLSATFTASFTTSMTLRTLFSNKKKSEICFNAEFLIHLWEIATSPQNNVCWGRCKLRKKLKVCVCTSDWPSVLEDETVAKTSKVKKWLQIRTSHWELMEHVAPVFYPWAKASNVRRVTWSPQVCVWGSSSVNVTTTYMTCKRDFEFIVRLFGCEKVTRQFFSSE